MPKDKGSGLSYCNTYCSYKNQLALISSGAEALTIIDLIYGNGRSDSESHKWTYHNGYHARTVGRDAAKICAKLNLHSVDKLIAQIAGFAHDIVQLEQFCISEAVSSEWLKQKLLEQGLPEDITHKASLAILGTEPALNKNGQIIGQKANLMAYPDRTTELIAKSVASADFGELFAPHGPYLSHLLFQELNGQPKDTLSFNKLKKFQRKQLELFTSYRFPLPAAEQLFTRYKKEVIEYSESLLLKLESGSVNSWRQIIDQDQGFMRRHT